MPQNNKKDIRSDVFFIVSESARRGSNPRPPPWQGGAPPLSHSRIITCLLSCRQLIIYYMDFQMSTAKMDFSIFPIYPIIPLSIYPTFWSISAIGRVDFDLPPLLFMLFFILVGFSLSVSFRYILLFVYFPQSVGLTSASRPYYLCFSSF